MMKDGHVAEWPRGWILAIGAEAVVDLLAGTDKRFPAVLGAASKLSETLYPQLLDRAVLINAPYIFGAIWSIVKGLM